MSSDDILSSVAKMWFARMMEGESKINERVTWGLETKAQVPLVQALTLGAGILAALVGMMLFGWAVAWILELKITAGDVLLAGTLITLGVAGLVVASVLVFRSGNMGLRVVYALVLAVVLAVGIAGTLTSARGQFDLLHGVALVLVPVLLVPGVALTYRQLADLFDPHGKTSPVERMMRPYIPQMFAGGTDEEGPGRLRVPYRVNGQVPVPEKPKGNVEGDVVVGLHPDDANLVDFVREAKRRGLARRKWLQKGRPNYVLPTTGTEVGRDTYDALIEEIVEWGFVAPGGDGKRAHWLMSWEDVIATIETEMVRQLGAAE